MAANKTKVIASNPIMPYSKPSVFFSTTMNTIATKNKVANSFHNLSCVELQLKIFF